MRRIYRIQDADGRGPYKPGFSAIWCDDYGTPPPPTWMEEFPGIIKRMNDENSYYGSGCRSVEQLGKWFTDSELLRLYILGYRAVSMHVDQILAESKNQLLFRRRKRLNDDIEFVDETAMTEGATR